MTAKDGYARQAAEIQRLFTELEEIYDRAAALMAESVLPPVIFKDQIKEERCKATAIMQRIRDIQEI